jgi:hypothetical protein
MLGVYGVSGKWYCPCHHNVNPTLNDAITAELHRQKPLVDRIVSLRRAGEASRELEQQVIDIVREIGAQQTIRGAGVIGPTHAEPHYTETQR